MPPVFRWLCYTHARLWRGLRTLVGAARAASFLLVTSGRESVAATTSYIAALFILLPILFVVLTLAAVPAVAATLATTATNQAEQRQSSHHGEAQFEESPAAHAAPPFCQLGDVLPWCIILILRQQRLR
jgi:hypothetical protein